MAIGPVGHLEVYEKLSQWTSEYEGQTDYFCYR